MYGPQTRLRQLRVKTPVPLGGELWFKACSHPIGDRHASTAQARFPALAVIVMCGYKLVRKDFFMENVPMAETAKPQQLKISTEHGDITVEMWADVAPKTVENFVTLAKKGFYNGLTFHRIIPGFMIQGGCPQGTGTGGPGYTIKAEFSNRKHARGVISMARSQDPNSAGSQFFIMHEAAPHLDGQYTCFGQVVAGMDVVDKIATTPLRDPGAGSPLKAPKITSITVL